MDTKTRSRLAAETHSQFLCTGGKARPGKQIGQLLRYLSRIQDCLVSFFVRSTIMAHLATRSIAGFVTHFDVAMFGPSVHDLIYHGYLIQVHE